MKVALVGFGNAGKTTLFHALVGGGHEAVRDLKGEKGRLGRMKVPDPRVDELAAIFQPEKKTFATVDLVDTPSLNAEKTGLEEHMRTLLGDVDVIVFVVQGFESETAPSPFLTTDPGRDISKLKDELILGDMNLAERRFNRLDETLKKGKRDKDLEAEFAVIKKYKPILDNGEYLFRHSLTPEELKVMLNFQFLTLHPFLFVINMNQERIAKGEALDLVQKLEKEDLIAVRLDAEIGKEIADLPEAERNEFLGVYGLEEPETDTFVHACYRLLNQITFYTVGKDDVRSWNIARGTRAEVAAGRIHTDLQRGFIKAEVISYADFMKAGGLPEAKKLGLLRLESRDYEVKDGDILNIKFAL